MFSNEYLLFTCKNRRRYSRERASQSLLKIIQTSETKPDQTQAEIEALEAKDGDLDGEAEQVISGAEAKAVTASGHQNAAQTQARAYVFSNSDSERIFYNF